MMAQTAIATATLLLGACAMARAPAELPPQHGATPDHQCEASDIQQFVGKQATAELGAQMLRTSGAGVLRWVPHGSVITLEYRFDRLTVYLDSANRIERINCG
jgi:hypothetical protein